MKKFLFMTAAGAALAFSSCKKDDDVQKNPDNGGTTKLLKKITKTEDNETTVYNFTYDGNKRLTSYKSADNKEVILFSYDGAGNIVKVEQSDDEFKNIYTYTYNNNIPVSGTFKSWLKHGSEPDALEEDDVLAYTITNDQVTNIHLNMTMEGQETDFKLSYTNGNLTKVETPGSELYTANFVYGTKKAAFPRLSKYILDQAGFSLQFFAKNELISASYDFPGTLLDKTVTTQYTYDASGLPLTSNDGETQLKFEYE